MRDPEPIGGNEPSPDLAVLGIIRTMTETFAVGPYRYTNLADAVAQAQRKGARSARATEAGA